MRDHWHDIELRTWNTRNGERNRYQESSLAEILSPKKILDIVHDRHETPLHGAAVFSGTVATVSG